MAFWGATVFFAAVGPCRVMSLETKKKFQLKKRQRLKKNHRRGHRTRARARINITSQTYGTEVYEQGIEYMECGVVPGNVCALSGCHCGPHSSSIR